VFRSPLLPLVDARLARVAVATVVAASANNNKAHARFHQALPDKVRWPVADDAGARSAASAIDVMTAVLHCGRGFCCKESARNKLGNMKYQSLLHSPTWCAQRTLRLIPMCRVRRAHQSVDRNLSNSIHARS